MRKKSWLIGATAMAAVAVFGALGMHSVKATGAESESAKEQIIFEQVGLDSYDVFSSGNGNVMLKTQDDKYYAKIDNDGTLTELDNSDGKFKKIAMSSGSAYDKCILSYDENDMQAVLNYDGSFAYGTDKYYEKTFAIRPAGQSVCAFVEDGKIKFNNKNGEKLFEIDTLGSEYTIRVSALSKYVAISYSKPSEHITKYYDLTGQEVPSEQVYNGGSVNIDSFYNNVQRTFDEPSDVTFDNGYKATYVGALKGQKVYYARKEVETRKYTYAILDDEGNELLTDVFNSRAAFGDKIVTRTYKDQDNTKAGSEYHIVKAVLATELKKDDSKNSVAEITAEDANLSSDVTYDELDADAKTVYDQKFNFNVKAADGVLADGAYISIAKAVTGSDYEAAKEVTKDVASHIAVFNIDLLKDGAKIQPNGNIEFTVNVPTGFNSDLVAVYRLSSDGKSYTKLSSSVKDGKVVFTTDHFSTYMIVEEKQAVKPDDNTAAGDNNNSNTANNNTANNDNSDVTDDNTGNGEQASASDANAAASTPGTGDVSDYIYYVIALVCAAAVGVVAMTAKNKKKAR